MSLSCTANEILSLVSQNLRKSRDTSHPFRGWYIMCALLLVCSNQHTKFEVRSFTDSKDMIGAKFKKPVTWLWPRQLGSSLSSKAKQLIYFICIQNVATIASVVREIWLRVSKFKNVSREPDNAPLKVVCRLRDDIIYLCTKFDDSSFSFSRDIIGARKIKMCHTNLITIFLRAIRPPYAGTWYSLLVYKIWSL